MGECHFTVGRIKLDDILCKNTTDREDREHETCNDPNADQPLHSCFTPSLSLVTYLDCESLANIHFLSSKKMHHLSQEHRFFLHGRLKVPALMAEFAGYFPVRT